MKTSASKTFLPWMVASSALNGVFAVLTFGSSVFILFLDELGLDKGQIGGIMSVFPFCGILALFIASGVARFGVKRTFLTFFGLRKVIMLAVLLTPWVLARGGADWAFYYVAGLMTLFAVCRAVAETAYFPWSQEIVPAYMRGKFDAIMSLVTTVALMGALLVAGKVLSGGSGTGLSRYMILIGVAVGIGLISVGCAYRIPGGRPVAALAGESPHFTGIWEALRDPNYARYLAGLAAVTLAFSGVVTFLPLYARQALGIDPGWVIRLDISSMLGGLISFYLWGCAADRYGSKPVTVTALTLMLVLPVGLLCVPRGMATAFVSLLGLMFFWGIGVAGMNVGASRLLNVNLVPLEKRTPYMAVYYAVIGLAGGLGPLAGGWLLVRLKGFFWTYGAVTVDAFGLLFGGFLGLLGIGWMLFRRLKTSGEMSIRQFAVQFIQAVWPGSKMP
jgi:MFS family permease